MNGVLAAVLEVVAGPPEYRDFISAGTYVIVTLITVFGTIFVAMLQRTNSNAKKAAKHAEPTGNGFANRTSESFTRLERSLGALHARLDAQDRREDRRDVMLTNFDSRLVNIEEREHRHEDPQPHPEDTTPPV